MPIIHHPHGATSIVGKTSINFFRLVTLLSGLRFEIKTGGMKLCRGPSCYSIIKREFGFKGNKEKVLAQFSDYVEAMRTQVEHVTEEPSK
jgi:hypothetical protein